MFLPTVSSTFGAVEQLPKDQAVELGASVITAAPVSGRTFTIDRRVSVADGDVGGRMELDAVARFLQDAGNDDTDDADLPELGLAWVARRALLEVHQPARTREHLTMTTWCSGTGSRWAERRTAITGDQGAHIEAAVVWVHLDATTGRPMAWGSEFADSYLEATAGRRVDAKLRHDKTPPPGADAMSWTFRKTDMDAFGHVNNAAYLAIAEEVLDITDDPCRVEIEWRGPSVANEPLTVDHAEEVGGTQNLWIRSADDDALRVTIRYTPLTG